MVEQIVMETSHWAHIERMPKTALVLISLMLPLTFLQKYKIRSFYLGLNRKPFISESLLDRKGIGFVSCNRILIELQSEKAISWEESRFSIYLSLHKNRLDFIHQGSNRKLSTCGEPFDWATIDYVPSIRILSQKFPKRALNINPPRLLK